MYDKIQNIVYKMTPKIALKASLYVSPSATNMLSVWHFGGFWYWCDMESRAGQKPRKGLIEIHKACLRPADIIIVQVAQLEW